MRKLLPPAILLFGMFLSYVGWSSVPITSGVIGIRKLQADVNVNVNASYVTVFSVTPEASKNLTLNFHIVQLAADATIGMQYRVSSADTGYTGTCAFTTYGISGGAASATVNENDIIAIAAAPADTGSAANCAAAPCVVDVSCALISDASPGAILLEGQLESGTATNNVKAGATYYTLVNN